MTRHIFLARPIHYAAEPEHEQCVRQFVQLALSKGWKVSESTRVGDSLVQRARNQLVNDALKAGCTDLLWWDADIAVSAEDVARMVEYPQPVTCIAYPKKAYNEDGIRDAGSRRERYVLEGGLDFVLQELDEDAASTVGRLVDGAMRVRFAGTGLMRIERGVLIEMMYRYPETLHVSGASGTAFGEPLFSLFDCAIDDRGNYLSEDYLFCDRWRAMGGDIWCLLDVDVAHIGRHAYRGNAARWMFQPMGADENGLPEEYGADGFWMTDRYEWAAEHLRGAERIADVCCGPGYGLPILARHGALDVVGYDRDTASIVSAIDRFGGEHISFRAIGDAEELTLSGFDALCCLETLEHMKEPVHWLKQLSSSVKRLVVSVPCVPTMHKNHHHLHDFTYDGMLKILQALGWSIRDHRMQNHDTVQVYAERA